MPRQRKRRGKTTQRSRAKRRGGLSIWLKLAILTPLALITVVIVLYAMLRSHLKGDEFRNSLVEQVDGMLDGNTELQVIHWDGWNPSAPSITFKNGRGPVKALETSELKVDLRIGSVLEDVWDVDHVEVLNVKANFGPMAKDYEEYVAEEPTGLAAWLPQSSKINSFEVKNFVGDFLSTEGLFEFADIRVKGEGVSETIFKMDLVDGSIKSPWEWLTHGKLIRSSLLLTPDRLAFEDASLRVYDDNTLKLNAAFGLTDDSIAVTGSVKEVDVERFLEGDWLRRFSGKAATTFSFDQEPGKASVCAGKLTVTQGVLENLPLLNIVADYTANNGYRNLSFEKLACQYSYSEGDLRLSKIDIASDNKISLKGDLFIGDDRSIDGVLKVGLPQGTLALIPGAESKVFHLGARGLMWAKVKVGGTLDNPTEDLSSQLKQAATAEFFNILPNAGKGLLGLPQANKREQSNTNPLADIAGKTLKGTGELSKVIPSSALNTGTDLLGNLLGAETPNRKKVSDWVYTGFGYDLDVDKKWSAVADQKQITNKAFAEIVSSKGVVAEVSCTAQSGKARERMKAWRKAVSGVKSKQTEFLTTSGFPAFLASSVDRNAKTKVLNGVCKVAAYVQVSEGKVLLLSLTAPAEEQKLALKELEDMAMSIRVSTGRNKVIPENKRNEVNPGGILPIPNPFGL